jgi:hypothetical protein
MLHPFLVVLGAATLGLFGCDDNSGTPQVVDAGPPPLRLELTPQDSTLKVTLKGGQSVQFAATAVYADDRRSPVPQAVWSVDDPFVGTIDEAGRFVATGMGKLLRVTASYREISATTTLNIILEDLLSETSVAGKNVERLRQPAQNDPTRAPAMIYPETETMIPFNLPPMLFQWNPGDPGNQIFGLRFQAPNIDLVVATAEAQWEGSTSTWTAIVRSAGGKTLAVSILGTGDIAGPMYTAGPTQLRVSSVAMSGAIYYWATGTSTGVKNGIMKMDAGTAVAKDFYTRANNGTQRCAGCHALSRDGTKIVFVENRDPDDDWSNYMKGLIVSSKATFLPLDKQIGDFFTFSPKGDRFISSEAGELTLRSANDGAVIVKPSGWTGQFASHPDWSPMGEQVALVLFPTSPPGDYHFCQGSIATADVTTGQTWPSKVLVQSSGPDDSNYYPTFSPDGKYLAFNKARAGLAFPGLLPCDLYSNPAATLYLVRASGGTPIALSRTNGPGDRTNSWPKWAPALPGSGTWWLAFSSTRDYGKVLVNSTKPNEKGAKRPQIWIAAIDTAALATGTGDPGFAAFWLPGQDTSSGNHIPFWTETLK